MPDRDGPGGAGVVLGLIRGAVVDDNHQIDSRDGTAGPDGCRDAFGLVLRRDDDGHTLVREL